MLLYIPGMRPLPVEGFSPITWENPQDIASEKDVSKGRRSGSALTVVFPLFLALVLLFVVFRDVSFTSSQKTNGDDADRWSTSLVTGPEAKRLMRYHGVNGLYMTDAKAFIKRNGRWICVFHDPPTAQELRIVRRLAAPPPDGSVTLRGKPSPAS